MKKILFIILSIICFTGIVNAEKCTIISGTGTNIGDEIDDIDSVEDSGCSSGFGDNLAQRGTRTFCPDQMRGSAGQFGQKCKRQDQYAHTADPVCCCTPEHYASRKVFKISCN